MMPNHNTESDADLARNETDEPVENAAGPAEAPELNASENQTPLADPDGGGAAVDQPDPGEIEQASSPGDEPVEEDQVASSDEVTPAEADEEVQAVEPAAAADVGEPPTAEVAEEGASEDEASPAEAEDEEVAEDEPPAVEPEETGSVDQEEVPAEAEEEGLAEDAVAPVAAAGAAVNEPPSVEAEEEGESGGESAPSEADEEGLAADEPLATDVEEAGATGAEAAPAEADEEASTRAAGAPVAAAAAGMAAVAGTPAADVEEAGVAGDESTPDEASEEGLAAAAAEPLATDVEEASTTGAEAAAAPMAAAAAAGTVIDEPRAVEEEEAGEAGGEAPLAEADGAALPAAAVGAATAQDLEDKKRRRLLVGLLALVALLIVAGALIIRYLLNPGPLPDLLPLPVDVNYRPHYLFSIHGIEKPVGVAVSPDGERIYVTETSGEREVKVFDRGGHLLHSFAPPYTGPAERAPVYVAVGPTGRVFVTDRLQRAVFVYDRDGKMLDAILGPDLTLSEYVSKHVDDFQPDSILAYNLFGHAVHYQEAGEDEQVLPAPDPAGWAPLGVRVDEQGRMLLTDVVEGRHAVREFPADLILASTWQEFDPPEMVFGAQGQDSGEFMYPNSAVADSKGRIFVTDGNNGRISVWDAWGSFLFDFGRGVGESALSLPRGAAMDKRDRLHIVDAVDQGVKVYDVSEPEPRFLFAFGDWGTKEGEFNYPGDIALDGTGRLYIADRENNRIQVWSY